MKETKPLNFASRVAVEHALMGAGNDRFSLSGIHYWQGRGLEDATAAGREGDADALAVIAAMAADTRPEEGFSVLVDMIISTGYEPALLYLTTLIESKRSQKITPYHFKKSVISAQLRYELAQMGHAESQYITGKNFDEGISLIKDWVQAYVYYNLAAAQGISAAVEARDSIEPCLSERDLTRAYQLSREFALRI